MVWSPRSWGAFSLAFGRRVPAFALIALAFAQSAFVLWRDHSGPAQKFHASAHLCLAPAHLFLVLRPNHQATPLYCRDVALTRFAAAHHAFATPLTSTHGTK